MKTPHFLLSAIALVACVTAGLTPSAAKDIVSPLYYGPNAFPVPEILPNTTGNLVLEVDAALADGLNAYDKSAAAEYLLRIPLWNDRVNLCSWGQMHEWYEIDWGGSNISRSTAGDVYYSIDVRLLNEGKWAPNVVLRLATKSASGYDSKYLRYYDSAGYHFDVNASKNVWMSKAGSRLYIAAYYGFLCWQTNVHVQNDAHLYAAGAGFESRCFNLKAEIGGYYGWQHNGDNPLAVKVRADILPGSPVSGFVAFQSGLRDWPFNQLKIGVRYSLKLIK